MKYIGFMTVAAITGVASAGAFFNEVEDNNTIALSNSIGSFDAPGGGFAIDGVLGENDVDWFNFTLLNDASLSLFTAFSAGDEADGIMQLVGPDGIDVLAFDDDSGVDFMPAIQIQDLVAGTYYIGLSGFGDVDSSSVDSDELADGLGHQENFAYKISIAVSIVPAPGAFALFGVGGIMMTRRQRA